MPSKKIIRLSRQKEEIREAALEIIKSQGYVTGHDVADRLEIPLSSASNVLRLHADEWGLDFHYVRPTLHGYSTGNLMCVYTEAGGEKPETVELSGHNFYKPK